MNHIRVLSILLFLLGIGTIAAILPNVHTIADFYANAFDEVVGDEKMGPIGFAIVTLITIGILGGPLSIAAAVLLWMKNRLARLIACIACIFWLPIFPFGTAIAIYGFIILRKRSA